MIATVSKQQTIEVWNCEIDKIFDAYLEKRVGPDLTIEFNNGVRIHIQIIHQIFNPKYRRSRYRLRVRFFNMYSPGGDAVNIGLRCFGSCKDEILSAIYDLQFLEKPTLKQLKKDIKVSYDHYREPVRKGKTMAVTVRTVC